MNFIKRILKIQLELSPWVIVAAILLAVIYGNLRVGIYFGFILLLVGNLIFLISYLFIEDKKISTEDHKLTKK